MSIRFGTSGWRAIIADQFTFSNVRLVTEAICSYLKDGRASEEQKLIVGHDSRFMGEKFAMVASEIAARKGFNVL
ncbi:MAG: phosphoglucomutase/phosphomannomutase family protein, partial [Pyrinomonadaceae bacterium]